MLPLFLFFCSNVLWLFEMVRFQSSMLLALHDAGQQVSTYAFCAEHAADLAGLGEDFALPAGAAEGALFTEGFVRNETAEKLSAVHAVAGGIGGISYLQSEYDLANGTVLLAADYQFRPFVPVIAPAKEGGCGRCHCLCHPDGRGLPQGPELHVLKALGAAGCSVGAGAGEKQLGRPVLSL